MSYCNDFNELWMNTVGDYIRKVIHQDFPNACLIDGPKLGMIRN